MLFKINITTPGALKLISGSNILFPLKRLIVAAPLLVIAGCYLNKEIRNDFTNIRIIVFLNKYFYK